MIERGFKSKLKQIRNRFVELWRQMRPPPVQLGSKFDKFAGLLQKDKDAVADERAKMDHSQALAEHEITEQRDVPNL